MFALVTAIAALGVVAAVAWAAMAALDRGPARPAGTTVLLLLGACVLALVVFLAGDDESAESAGMSRWSAHGAQEVTELVIAGSLVAGGLALVALRGGARRRLMPALAACATLAAFGGLWLIAVVHSLHFS